MFSEFGIIVLVQLLGFGAVFIYMIHALNQRLERLEAQHATILEKLDRRNNGDGGREYRHLGEQAGKLIDEYRRLILLANDPKDVARYDQMIAELKERM